MKMKGYGNRSKPCFPTGNKYRGKHDDGSRMSRDRAGAMSMKHHSPATHKGMM